MYTKVWFIKLHEYDSVSAIYVHVAPFKQGIEKHGLVAFINKFSN